MQFGVNRLVEGTSWGVATVPNEVVVGLLLNATVVAKGWDPFSAAYMRLIL